MLPAQQAYTGAVTNPRSRPCFAGSLRLANRAAAGGVATHCRLSESTPTEVGYPRASPNYVTRDAGHNRAFVDGLPDQDAWRAPCSTPPGPVDHFGCCALACQPQPVVVGRPSRHRGNSLDDDGPCLPSLAAFQDEGRRELTHFNLGAQPDGRVIC